MHVQSASPSYYVDIIIFSYFPYHNRTVQFGTVFCRNHRRWRPSTLQQTTTKVVLPSVPKIKPHIRNHIHPQHAHVCNDTNYERPKHRITIHSFVVCPPLSGQLFSSCGLFYFFSSAHFIVLSSSDRHSPASLWLDSTTHQHKDMLFIPL